MSEVLEVWLRGGLAGQFLRSGHSISFRYEDGYAGPPLSLSLPKGEKPAKLAARHYLDNLLPDNPRVRRRWARKLEVADDSFSILEHMGEDLAGAFSITPAGHDPKGGGAPLVLLDEDELHYRAAMIQNDEDLWMPTDEIGKVRMSLAGAQGKFSLVNLDGLWFFSTISNPSTHIFKPAAKRFPEVAMLEAASLALADAVGISAPSARAMDLGSTRGTFVVERFDRKFDEQTGRTVRVHAEDMAQAQGRTPEDKYRVPAKDVVAVLARHASDEDAPYAFVEMLAFNVAIGNADAHGKNYSVLIADDGSASLAPIYDTVPTAFYAHLSDRLAMKVGRGRDARNVQVGDWRKFALDSGLDPDRVTQVARSIHDGVAEAASETYRAGGLTGGRLDRMNEIVGERTRALSGPGRGTAGAARPARGGGAAASKVSSGECAAPTADGTPCRNPKDACPHH